MMTPVASLSLGSITELVVESLHKRFSHVNIFLLDSWDQVFCDFSRPEDAGSTHAKSNAAGGHETANRGQRITDEYLGHIRERIQRFFPEKDTSAKLVSLLEDLSNTEGDDLTAVLAADLARIISCVPQNPFCVMAGDLYKHYLAGNPENELPLKAPFSKVSDFPRVYKASLAELGYKNKELAHQESDRERVYWPTSKPWIDFRFCRDCGIYTMRLAELLLPQAEDLAEDLYVVPLKAANSLVGSLYALPKKDQDDKAVLASIAEVVPIAEQLLPDALRSEFRLAVYDLMDVETDPLEVVLHHLAKCENVMLGALWDLQGSRTHCWERQALPVGADDYKDLIAYRWREAAPGSADSIYCDRQKRLSELKKVNKPTVVKIDELPGVLNESILKNYEKYGFPLRYGIILPSSFLYAGSDFRGHDIDTPLESMESLAAVEVFYADPFISSQDKVPVLVPLFQLAVQQHNRLRQETSLLIGLVSDFLSHETYKIIRALDSIKESGTPDMGLSEPFIQVMEHFRACLAASSLVESAESLEVTTRERWQEVCASLSVRLQFLFGPSNLEISEELPEGVQQLRIDYRLLYVICSELVRNAHRWSPTKIVLRVEPEPHRAKICRLRCAHDGNCDFARLTRTIDHAHDGRIGKREGSATGETIIIWLLRYLMRGMVLPVAKPGQDKGWTYVDHYIRYD